jgi:excinuclease ABC subunit A
MRHPLRGERRPLATADRWLEIRGAELHNLKHVNARIPVGRLTVLTGISGSGKSTLMRGVLKPLAEEALARPTLKRKPKKGAEADVRGELISLIGTESDELDFAKGTLGSRWKRALATDVLEAVYEVDQSPIGKTSRSTPATYIKVFDEIRALYAQMPLARMRGYTASRFSFNTEGGRCETCTGQGMIKIEMNVLPTTWLPCPDCTCQRYNAATLEVLYNDRSIGDVMHMTLAEASEFFRNITKIHRPLKLLCDTGLGYLQLGQPSPTLSGGEAQRLKLVAELTRGSSRSENARMKQRTSKSMLYLLEEPTIGLHLCDVQKLLEVLHRLVDDGATVVVIEHHLNLIAEADFVLDLGPEAGEHGGEIVACGTPEEIVKVKRSRTAPFLKEVLEAARQKPKPEPKAKVTRPKVMAIAAA